jgi:hypothetical protein
VQGEIKAAEQLASLLRRYDRSREADVKRLMDALDRFVQQHGGTRAAAEAKQLLGQLRK